jgi:glutamate synthase domain-containing protein 1
MCGIAGYFRKNTSGATTGSVLLEMLRALALRGPDSAGVAMYGQPSREWIFRIKAGETVADSALVARLLSEAKTHAEVTSHSVTGASLRMGIEGSHPEEIVNRLVSMLEAVPGGTGHGVEVVSVGHSLEIVKQVGSPNDLERAYQVSEMDGPLGIGHTRLSTESRIDLSHSQPFWAHGLPDVAAVHNGHITNYGRLRRQFEQRGIRFYTENDSEVIGIYLLDRVARGDSLEEAMRASMRDFDGSFCYLVAAPGFLGFAKDRFGLKPLMVAETDDWVAVATEEVALRQALGDGFRATEPPPGTLQVWRSAKATG